MGRRTENLRAILNIKEKMVMKKKKKRKRHEKEDNEQVAGLLKQVQKIKDAPAFEGIFL